MRIGVHVSIIGSIAKAVDRASERGCNTFQIFTRNPRSWKAKPLDDKEASGFLEKVKRTKIFPAIAHMPYLPNLASPRKKIYEKSVDSLASELQRCEKLGIRYLVTHLGSHVGSGYELGLKSLLKALDTALSRAANNVILLLENTAGTRQSMCSTFPQIEEVIEGLEHHSDRLGVCFDTCHGFAAGYDLRNDVAVGNTILEFDNTISLRRMKVIHVNDSKGKLNSGVDRHEHVGLGHIGEEGFRAILSHPKLRALPLIMETPVDERRDDYGNIRKLKQLAEGKQMIS